MSKSVREISIEYAMWLVAAIEQAQGITLNLYQVEDCLAASTPWETPFYKDIAAVVMARKAVTA